MKRTLSVRVFALILSVLLLLSVAGCADTETEPVTSSADVSATDTAAEPEIILSPSDFVHAEGTILVDENGEQYVLRGMNFCNDALLNPPVKPWDPIEERYSDLKACGINTVRFLINYGLFEDDNNPYVYKESGFRWLDKNIALAKKYGIKLLFNMHLPQEGWPTNGRAMPIYASDGTEYQKRLASLWRAIAERYYNEPTVLGYSLANEPVVLVESTTEEAYDRYCAILQSIVDSVREVDPNHLIVVEAALGFSRGDGRWVNKVNAGFPVIEDDNYMLEFHNYDPVYFTCQGEREGIKFTSSMRKQVERNLLSSAKYAWEQGVPALCGEMGAGWATYEYEETTRDWMHSCIDIFEENDIAYCFFAFWDEYMEPTTFQYSFWNDKMMGILQEKIGDPNAKTCGAEGANPEFHVPVNGYAYADYMKASGVNCMLSPYYSCQTHEYFYFSEPIMGWTGNNMWHIELDLGTIETRDSEPVGKMGLEVISYGHNEDAYDVKFNLNAYLRDPEGDAPDIILKGYPKYYSLELYRDDLFNQNLYTIYIHDFGGAKTIGELRDYWLVIDAEILQASNYYEID